MNESSKDPIQRLTGVVRSGVKPGWRVSDAMLLNEYVRRLACLEQKVPIHVSGLFFDPVELPGANEEQLKQDRQDLSQITKGIGNRFWATLLQNYALWTVLVRAGNPIATLEPDLFEPLMRMFERGAAFTLHHGEALFENHAVPLQTWRNAASRQPIEIDEDKLLQWDKSSN
jgi:hypothetical protein